MHWLKVNTQYQMSLPFRISKTHLELQDYHIDLDSLTKHESETPFKLEQHGSETYEKETDVMMDITIEMNKDLKRVLRQSYSLIDLLSDIGGVQSIFFSSFAIVLSVLNYQHFDTHIASQLFKIQKLGLGSKYAGELEMFSPSLTGNTKEFFQDLCCRR